VSPDAIEIPARALDDFLPDLPQDRPRLGLAGKHIAIVRVQAKEHPYYEVHVGSCAEELSVEAPSLKKLQ
tara:strand:- start:519 stop:728 length:210 start_codon:yes stop_codon:yes gene_type:complete